jgi:putative transposase
MCQVLNVSRSGYYAWRKRLPSVREMANQKLLQAIRKEYQESDEVYGSPRITEALRRQGWRCGENRVARLMHVYGLKAKAAQRFRTTTRRNPAHPVAPNLLRRNFTADRPNQIWLADITYIPTHEGWLYLAAVLDLYSRRIVGWAMQHRMTEELTLAALRMALQQRRPELALLHHSDQGSQYTSGAYQNLLKGKDIQVSMNGVGTWYDNAPMESFFGSLKAERVHHLSYHTRREARQDLFRYIESFYNRRRLHSSIGYRSPVAFEQAYQQQLCTA